MSKYYKAEDVIRKYAEMIADEAYWEHGVGNGKPDEEDLDIARKYYSDLPTIEVSEDCISREWVKGICESMLDEEMLGYMLEHIEDAPSIVPQVPSEDCISRADAVNALIAHFIPQTYTGEEVEQASKLARKIMANAPSVVPSRAEGEWIEDEYGIPHCSECNCINNTVYRNFCPNCGARMKG